MNKEALQTEIDAIKSKMQIAKQEDKKNYFNLLNEYNRLQDELKALENTCDIDGECLSCGS